MSGGWNIRFGKKMCLLSDDAAKYSAFDQAICLPQQQLWATFKWHLTVASLKATANLAGLSWRLSAQTTTIERTISFIMIILCSF
jgi:hypothetical protein